MESEIRDRVVAAAVEGIDARLSVLLADDWAPAGGEEASVRVREIERLSRRLHAVQLQVLDQIGRSGVFKADGHASAKVMVRHGANLSGAEALRREQVDRMQRSLPVVAAGHAAGRIGTPQVERIARTHANRRVREQLIAEDAGVAHAATMLPYDEFDAALTNWERLVDEDGAGDRAERNHARRNFRTSCGLDGSHRIEGAGGSVDGAVIDDIWQRQVQSEFDADWADARGRLGDATTVADLARTDAQRRYDAFKACMTRGDLAHYGVDARTCTDLVIDEVTFERHVAKLHGINPGPDPRLVTWWNDLLDQLQPPEPTECDPGHEPNASSRDVTGGLVGFRCGTIDGRPLDPTEVVVATLIGQVRRVVTGADGVVLDMGRKARCFTGARQLAVRLSHSTCVWTGCQVASGQCQSDHLTSFNGPQQGRTSPDNGGPACGRHNRLKEQGYTVVRDQRGRWHVYRPDGTEIT